MEKPGQELAEAAEVSARVPGCRTAASRCESVSEGCPPRTSYPQLHWPTGFAGSLWLTRLVLIPPELPVGRDWGFRPSWRPQPRLSQILLELLRSSVLTQLDYPGQLDCRFPVDERVPLCPLTVSLRETMEVAGMLAGRTRLVQSSQDSPVG